MTLRITMTESSLARRRNGLLQQNLPGADIHTRKTVMYCGDAFGYLAAASQSNPAAC
jgi:hypothetical protein